MNLVNFTDLSLILCSDTLLVHKIRRALFFGDLLESFAKTREKKCNS